MSRVTETPEMAPVAPASKVPSALGVLAALGVPAWACLLCFTDYEDRLRICHIFAGREGPELHRCREALTNAFKVLQDTEINYEERAHLHDTFSQMTHSLEEIATAQGSFEVAFPDAVEKVQKVIMQLKEAPPCIPPCGLQEASRRFRCRGCYSALCDLPLDCPVQDVTVTRGHQALFSCTVDFPLPKEEISYSWKFAAGGLRTQDQTYFRDLPRSSGYLARIRPVQPEHRGTFSCVIAHDQRLLARLYFFLNVTGLPPRRETKLQGAFRDVLRWAPREAVEMEPWRPSLGELLASPGALTPRNLLLMGALGAFAAACVTMLVWSFIRWYCSG
ncbi:sperm acrosome membrane-associated protein 6 isoform X8 [Erinaceus europaeus]|uniref:Sperm acrosome membrane-associated protein 6 isoform X8 n=1 Tax=Erinaceus europaeus TaxID=9365 RepID=A0ABM3W4M8_ERIEU|nr:sperm acrosome membrane-associated protein 6 isoform X8 [Erinaceus europaeus]XP_060031533.1 sperm acrosome membrane-associated protein 6 isoform X8 [Erinaceus europaeus]